MSSQFVMTSRAKRPKSSVPFAFTELGAVMLSSVLRSDVAVKASILIVRAFVATRQLVFNRIIHLAHLGILLKSWFKTIYKGKMLSLWQIFKQCKTKI